jgi:hypothetical protein
MDALDLQYEQLPYLKISDCPFKIFDFWKFTFTIYIEILFIATYCFF